MKYIWLIYGATLYMTCLVYLLVLDMYSPHYDWEWNVISLVPLALVGSVSLTNLCLLLAAIRPLNICIRIVRNATKKDQNSLAPAQLFCFLRIIIIVSYNLPKHFPPTSENAEKLNPPSLYKVPYSYFAKKQVFIPQSVSFKF